MKHILLFLFFLSVLFFTVGSSTAGQVQLLTQNFDSTAVGSIPTGWTQNGLPGTWKVNAGTNNPTGGGAHSGSNLIYLDSYTQGSGTQTNLVSPSFSMVNISNGVVSFWMYRDNIETNPDKIMVYVSTSKNITVASFLGTVNRATTLNPVVASTGWYQYTYNIPVTFTGNTNYLIFNGISGYGNDIHLDDISVYYTVPDKIDQVISNFTPPTTKTYGDVPITLSATGGSSENPVIFSINSGDPGNIIGNQLTITGAGTINLKASQAGNTNYNAAPDVSASITVSAKPLSITAGSTSRIYGAVNPVVTAFTVSTLAGTDSISSITNTIAGSATPTAAPGTLHAITPGAAVFGSGLASNYNITYSNGTLTILDDIIAPSVTAFTIPKTSSEANIVIESLIASDNGAVTGFCVTEENISTNCSWSVNPPSNYRFSATGTKYLYAFAKDAKGNVSPSMSASIDVGYLLTLSISGDGSVNGGLACVTSNCSARYFGLTELLLMASTSPNTLFGGWTGDCSTINSKSCTVTMDNIKNVTANFVEAAKVRNGKAPFTSMTSYTSLALAFSEVKSDELVQARSIEFDGPLVVTRIVSFKGGFNADYSDNNGSYTLLRKKLTIGVGGRLNVERLKVLP